MRFVPKESGAFTVVLLGTDETGKSAELSKGFDIRILDKISSDNVSDTGVTLEVTVMVICIILGVFVLLALIIASIMLTEKLTGKSNRLLDVLRSIFTRKK